MSSLEQRPEGHQNWPNAFLQPVCSRTRQQTLPSASFLSFKGFSICVKTLQTRYRTAFSCGHWLCQLGVKLLQQPANKAQSRAAQPSYSVQDTFFCSHPTIPMDESIKSEAHKSSDTPKVYFKYHYHFNVSLDNM